MTGIERVADSIKAEFEQLLPGQRKTQRGKLSLLVATMLDARSCFGAWILPNDSNSLF